MKIKNTQLSKQKNELNEKNIQLSKQKNELNEKNNQLSKKNDELSENINQLNKQNNELNEKNNQLNKDDNKDENNNEQFKIIDIKCGGEHSVFLSSFGRVYVCGHGYHGQLGLGNTKNVNKPIIVMSLLKKKIIKIAAGWSHTIILSDENMVYVTGCVK